jgi:hypothetical protein
MAVTDINRSDKIMNIPGLKFLGITSAYSKDKTPLLFGNMQPAVDVFKPTVKFGKDTGFWADDPSTSGKAKEDS